MTPALLANLARFLREALRRDERGRLLAAALGLRDVQILERFQVGFSNGSLLKAIPTKGGSRDELMRLGLLDQDGNDVTQGCLLVPVFDRQDAVSGFVAIDQKGQESRFPGSLPLYGVHVAALQEESVVFTASVLDCLRFAQAGQAAMPLLPEISREERDLLARHRPKRAVLAADNAELLGLLQKLEVPCARLALAWPATGPQVEEALRSAEPIGERLGPEAVVRTSGEALRFECGHRVYEVKDLAPGEPDRLRVRVKAVSGERFSVDTLDLYAGRSRAALARASAPLLGVSSEAVEADLCLVIKKLEAIRATRRVEAVGAEPYAMTADEEAEALAFLKRPDLLEQVVRDMEALGCVGEAANKKLAYLASVSRKLESPLCAVILSRAAAGKSRLLSLVAELAPPEDVVSYTRITPQALYYAGARGLKNKLVVAGEDEGLWGSDYPLRELISSKRIKLAAPVKDSATGKMKTVEYEVEGPIALLTSTTRPAIHHENATRCFLLSLDESAEQTGSVMRFQGGRKSLDGVLRTIEARGLRRLHRNAQRLLRPLLVVIPFADLSSRFPVNRIESRRENEKYHSLIEAVAFLRQHQREAKRLPFDGGELEYIEATREDVAEADRLMAEGLAEQGAELSAPSRRLLDLIRRMVEERANALDVEPGALEFNRRDIREATGWSDNQIKAHVKRLEDLEFLQVKAGQRGRLYRYQLGSWEEVGRKLGGGERKDSAGISNIGAGSSWEVGRFAGKGYRAASEEAAETHV